jgi:hypothetical protein
MAHMLLKVLSYLVSVMVNDCPVCGRNGDLCICDAPVYEEREEIKQEISIFVEEKPMVCGQERDDVDDRLACCSGCEQYDCICGEYEDV